MIATNLSMPHPVLGIQDDMEGLFSLDLTISVDRETRMYVFKEITIGITNTYIKSLVDAGLIDKVIKISCIPTYKTWTFLNSSEIRLPEMEIDLLVEIEAYLVSNRDIKTYHDASFNPIFGNQIFELERGSIIGLTGSKRIPIIKEHEKVSLGSIFRFSKIKREEENQEIYFSFDDDQIVIYYPGLQQDYDPVTFLFDKNQGLPYTALNLYIIPALAEAFRYMEEENNDVNKRWCFVLDSLLPKSERDADYFVNAQRVLKTGVPVNLAFEEILKSKNIRA